MKKQIMSKRGRRFDEGGEVQNMPRARTAEDDQEAADKAAGLAASNKEKPMGFFERLRAGNIDDPTSEAYKRFGAGRGRADRAANVPVEDKSFTPVEYRRDFFGKMTQKEKDERPSHDEYDQKLRGEEQSKRQPSGDASVAEDYAGPRTKPVVSSSTSVKPTGTSTVKAAPSSENKTRSVDETSSTKKMEEDMRNYKPRYTPPGSAPKTTTQKHPPKVFMPERPDNSFPGSKYKSGGSVASSRADGIAQRGKTRGKMC
jgi:hypothetical protein